METKVTQHQHSERSLNKAARFSCQSMGPMRKDEVRGFSRRSSGFTLIEMLLVIAIMALITSLGILAYRNNAVNNRITKASLETQNVLAAAMAYRADQADWPTAHDLSDCSTTEPDTDDTFITSYLPNESADTTYGGYYCWGTNSTSSLFWVALEVPSDDASLAKRIAAQLPNAIDTTDPTEPEQYACSDDNSTPCYVRAEVAQINTSTSTSDSSLVGMGYCDPSDSGATVSGSSSEITCTQNTSQRDQYTIAFSCESNETGTVYVTPNFYSNPGGNKTVTANLTHLSASGSHVDSCSSTQNNGATQWSCTISLIAQYDGTNSVVNANGLSNGTIGATYTAFCKTNTITSAKQTNTYHY